MSHEVCSLSYPGLPSESLSITMRAIFRPLSLSTIRIRAILLMLSLTSDQWCNARWDWVEVRGGRVVEVGGGCLAELNRKDFLDWDR